MSSISYVSVIFKDILYCMLDKPNEVIAIFVITQVLLMRN